MKVLVIYSSDCAEEVKKLRAEIAERFGKESVLRLLSTNRKKSLLPHAWHFDAVKMMKLADIIVYAFSENSFTNKNVNWELCKALKLKKYIVCLPVKETVTPENKCLYKIDENMKEEICLASVLTSKEDLFALIEEYNNGSYIKLLHEECDPQILLEQYKIFAETAENLVSRRQNVNSFYITATTALITIGGTVFALGSDGVLASQIIVAAALTIPGFLMNISWYKMLQSYFVNNQGKMKVLSLIEKKLAASMYDAEWKAMKNRYSKKKYISFTQHEKSLPIAFSVFYALIDVACIGYFVFLFLVSKGVINIP